MTASEASSHLIQTGHRLGARGWLRATSGNLSLRVSDDPLTMAITRSGSDKQSLEAEDIIGVSRQKVIWGTGRPSAETGIHEAIYTRTSAGAVLHVHTVFNNLASSWADAGHLHLSGNEMLKALGFWDEDAACHLPVIPNYADLERLAETARAALDSTVPGLLIAGHGLYAFGNDLKNAVAHLEAFEFLFEWLYYQRLGGQVGSTLVGS